MPVPEYHPGSPFVPNPGGDFGQRPAGTEKVGHST